MHLSFAFLPALAAVIYAQGTALPDEQTTTLPATTATATSASASGDCNFCYIVADVAQVIFAEFTQTATASAVVAASTGRNGTVVSTTLMQPAQSFSFGSNGLLGGSPVTGSYIPISGTTFEVNGATLTSPTAYNVFTAYTSFTKTLNAAGSCVSSAVSVFPLSPAKSYKITVGAPATQAIDAESSFVNDIGKATCVVSAAVISSTIPFSATTTTVISTTSIAPTRQSSLPVSSAAESSSASSASASATSTATSSTSITFSILTPTPTPIITGAGSIFHPPTILPRTFSATLITALLVLPGIAAWIL